jgi:hypothetical protein
MSKSTQAMSRMNDLPTDLFNHVLSFRETYREKMLRCFDERYESLQRLCKITVVPGNFNERFNLKTWGISLQCTSGGEGMLAFELDVSCSRFLSVNFFTDNEYEFDQLKWELEDFCEKNFPDFDKYVEL